MLDALKEERIVSKVGGRFRLSTLIQKRMVALNRGARPLVDLEASPMEIVLREIVEEKIFLDEGGALKTDQDQDQDQADEAGESIDVE